MRIGFWKTKRSELYVSHQKGLNDEQIKELHNLSIGDRLCIWESKEIDGNMPNLVLKILKEDTK